MAEVARIGPNGIGTDFLLSIWFDSKGARGWASGVGGRILRTDNGGATWSLDASATDQTLYSVTGDEHGNGWAVGVNQTVLIKNVDQASWKKVTLSLKSTDGGAAPTTYDLFSLCERVDPTTGQATFAAVGSNGLIVDVSTETAWVYRHSPKDYRLISIACEPVGAVRGYAVGEWGTITSLQASRWTDQFSGTDAGLTGVAMSRDGSKAWAVGVGGVVLTTSDGGAHWTKRREVGSGPHLYSVAMNRSGTQGWAVGTDGTVIRTVDGGVTWDDVSAPTTKLLTATCMVGDGPRGWAVGQDPLFMQTTDGGATWQVL